jgi:hypothetical protein
MSDSTTTPAGHRLHDPEVEGRITSEPGADSVAGPNAWRGWATQAWQSRPTVRGRHPRGASYALLGIVAAQAVWFAVLSSRGWFYTDDFQDMAQSLHRSLGPSYLLSPLNDHLSPGVRLVFWLTTHVIGLHYGPTIAVRVVIQAVTTLLLYRLLRLVSPSARLALGITAVYAFSPLLVPGTLWLTTALTLQIPQIATILAFDAHIRHARTGSWWWSAASGLNLLIAASFWEKSGITAVLLVILSLGWLQVGGLRRRIWAVVRDWRGWLLTLGPLVAFAAYDIASGTGKSATTLPVTAALRLTWLQWSQALWPSVIGGPWHWFAIGSVYQSIARPGVVAIVIGQCTFVALAAVGWRRNRWAGVFAWFLPLVSVALGITLVGVGRYALLNTLIATDFHYGFDLAIPTALAAALSLARTGTPVPQRVRSPWRARALTVAAVGAGGAVLASCIVSAATWTQRWHVSPAHTYTASVLKSVKALGPNATLYDTPVSPRVLPLIEGDRHLSNLLALAGVQVHINNGPEPPQVIDDHGHARPATFFVAAVGHGTRNRFCPNALRGQQPLVVPLRGRVTPNEYFLRLTYFQNRPTRLLVTVTGPAGKPIAVPASPLALDSTLGQTVVRLGFGQPATLTLQGSSAATNYCLTKAELGVPLAGS